MPEHAQHHAEPRESHHPHHSMGGAGHWVKTLGLLAPLIIGEVVKDPDKRWRFIRISSVAMALISEAMWATKVHHERHSRSEDRGYAKSA